MCISPIVYYPLCTVQKERTFHLVECILRDNKIRKCNKRYFYHLLPAVLGIVPEDILSLDLHHFFENAVQKKHGFDLPTPTVCPTNP